MNFPNHENRHYRADTHALLRLRGVFFLLSVVAIIFFLGALLGIILPG